MAKNVNKDAAWFPKPSLEVSGPAGRIRIASEDLERYERRGYSAVSGTEITPNLSSAPPADSPANPPADKKDEKAKSDKE